MLSLGVTTCGVALQNHIGVKSKRYSYQNFMSSLRIEGMFYMKPLNASERRGEKKLLKDPSK